MKLTKSLLIATLACGTLWAQTPADQTDKPSSKNPPPAAKNAPAKKPASAAKPSPAPAPVKGTASASPAKPSQNQAPAAHATAVPAKGTAPAKSAAKPPVVAAKPAAKPPVIVAKPAAKPPVIVAKPAAKPSSASPFRAAAKTVPPPPKKAVGASQAKVQPAAAKEHATSTRTTAIGGKQRDPFVSPIVRTGGNLGSGCDTGKRCLVVDQIVLKGIVKSVSGYIAVVENPAKRAYFMRENDPVFNGKIVKITGDTVVFQEQTMDKVGKQSVREVVKKVNAPVV